MQFDWAKYMTYKPNTQMNYYNAPRSLSFSCFRFTLSVITHKLIEQFYWLFYKKKSVFITECRKSVSYHHLFVPCHGPLVRYVQFRVVYFSPPRVGDPDIHHGMCVTHFRPDRKLCMKHNFKTPYPIIQYTDILWIVDVICLIKDQYHESKYWQIFIPVPTHGTISD